MRVVLELARAAEDRPPAVLRRAGRCCSSRRLSSSATSYRFIRLPEPVGHSIVNVVAVVAVVLQQRPDDQRVDRHPDRAAPVRVAAEHAAVGLGGQVGDAEFLAADIEHVRMLGVVASTGSGCRAGSGTRPRRASWRGRGGASLVQDRCEPPAARDPCWIGSWMNARSFGRPSRKSRARLASSRVPLEQPAIERGGRAQRQQPDHRADLEALGACRRAVAARRRRSRPPRPTCRCRRRRASSPWRSTGSAR